MLLLQERSEAEPGLGSHPSSFGIGVTPSLFPPPAKGVCSSPPCAAFAGCTSRSISLHPTALGLDLFKTLETPKSHPLAAFWAHSLGIKMMGCRCLHPASSPSQAEDVMQQ